MSTDESDEGEADDAGEPNATLENAQEDSGLTQSTVQASGGSAGAIARRRSVKAA